MGATGPRIGLCAGSWFVRGVEGSGDGFLVVLRVVCFTVVLKMEYFVWNLVPQVIS